MIGEHRYLSSATDLDVSTGSDSGAFAWTNVENPSGCGAADLRKQLSSSDRAIIVQALAALLRDRIAAMRIMDSIATTTGTRRPEVDDFALPDILRLSRWFESP